jgi:hypothetical protein
LPFPAWFASIVQVPVPLFIVTVPLASEHTDVLPASTVKDTVNPESEVAATGKVAL